MMTRIGRRSISTTKTQLFAASSHHDSLLINNHNHNNDNNNNNQKISTDPLASKSVSAIGRMRVHELRTALDERGLTTEGLKPVLVSRLFEFLQQSSSSQKNATHNNNSSNSNNNNHHHHDGIHIHPDSQTQDTQTQSPQHPQFDPTRRYVLRFRGSTASSFSSSGIGLVLYDLDSEQEVWFGQRYFHAPTSHFEAEYRGLLLGLRVVRYMGIRKLVLQSDNAVLLQQLRGQYQVRQPHLQKLYWPVMQLVDHGFEECHVGSTPIGSLNARATLLAKRTLAAKKSSPPLLDMERAIMVGEQWRRRGEGGNETQEQEQDPNDTTTDNCADPTEQPGFEEGGSSWVPPDERDTEEEDSLRMDDRACGGDNDKKQNSINHHGDDHDHLDAHSDDDKNEYEYDDDRGYEDAPHTIDPTQTYLLRFDGGSRGNPGIAGAGMVLYTTTPATTTATTPPSFPLQTHPLEEIWCGWKFLGHRSATNNEAEYTGLIAGLQCAHSMGITKLHIQGDSDLIVKQVNGIYRCRQERLKPYWKAAKTWMAEFEQVALSHIPRKENARADQCANQAMVSVACFAGGGCGVLLLLLVFCVIDCVCCAIVIVI